MPSRRVLKSVAHNFGYSTMHALGDRSNWDLSELYQAAHRSGASVLTFDILNDVASPSALVNDAVAETAAWSRWFLGRLLEGAGLDFTYVRHASMTIGLSVSAPTVWAVEIEDDR